MAEKRGFYSIYSYGDRLEPGKQIKIEHSLHSDDDGTRVGEFTHLPAKQLQALRDYSAAREKKIFENLLKSLKEWEEQAAQTMLLDDAIEYIKTEPVKHTSNEWDVGRHGHGFECSNMVYRMFYYIYEDTKYNRETQQQDVVAWQVSWDLSYNFPEHARGGGNIAGQERKKFTSKEKMDNYIIGRIAAYADYFTELSPPVPKNLAWKFSRNGVLLPGYTLQVPEPQPVKVSETPGTDYSKFIKKPQRDAGKKKSAPVR